MDTWMWIVIAAVAVVVLALIGLVIARRRRSTHLRETFGSEYDRMIAQADSRGDAEMELSAREKRHEDFELKPLSPAARSRFQQEWTAVQSRFVDDPEGAVRGADNIVGRVMEEQGYPANGDAEARAADLSVEHADVVGQYRRGHALLEGSRESNEGTEHLRQAMRCFRTAFEELIEDGEVART
jgi:hypothetical protein